jgi:hypothetical protein
MNEPVMGEGQFVVLALVSLALVVLLALDQVLLRLERRRAEKKQSESDERARRKGRQPD